LESWKRFRASIQGWYFSGIFFFAMGYLLSEGLCRLWVRAFANLCPTPSVSDRGFILL
jgi:hypothetical protein